MLRALRHDSLVPSAIETSAGDSWVTLSGMANYQYQRAEAERARGISNDIGLIPSNGDVARRIVAATQRYARLDASTSRSRAQTAPVTLRSTVGAGPTATTRPRRLRTHR